MYSMVTARIKSIIIPVLQTVFKPSYPIIPSQNRHLTQSFNQITQIPRFPYIKCVKRVIIFSRNLKHFLPFPKSCRFRYGVMCKRLTHSPWPTIEQRTVKCSEISYKVSNLWFILFLCTPLVLFGSIGFVFHLFFLVWFRFCSAPHLTKYLEQFYLHVIACYHVACFNCGLQSYTIQTHSRSNRIILHRTCATLWIKFNRSCYAIFLRLMRSQCLLQN